MDKVKELHLRVLMREKINKTNKLAADLIMDKARHVQFSDFVNSGYKGAYEMNENGIWEHKGLGKNKAILDFMDYDELLLNWIKTDRAVAKMSWFSSLRGNDFCDIHLEEGYKVRQKTFEDYGIYPEQFATPSKSIVQVKSVLREFGID